jgi:hypothetical protein
MTTRYLYLSSTVAALTLVLMNGSLGVPTVWAAAQALDISKIEQLTGVKGKLNDKEGVFKVSLPRKDLQVTVAGVHMTPPMGLTSWAAFTRAGEKTLVMGDMALLEDQVNPVMSVALDNGLEVTALHNHFFWDSPKVMFMHIGGSGSEEKLAAAVGKVFAKDKETSDGKAHAPYIELDPAKTSLDPKKIEDFLGVKGEMTDSVYKVTLGRTTKMGEHAIGNAMGVNTWAAFVGSDEKAVVDGDFAMYEDELQSVLKALRAAGINIVAIHSHMSMESPKVAFLHYWGIGSTTELAKALKSALDTQRGTP